MIRYWALPLAGAFIGVLLVYGHGVTALLEERRWERGKSYLAEGRAREAKKAFESLIEEYPKEPDLHLFFAVASMRLGDVQAAELHIKRALSLFPQHVEAMTLQGWLHLEVHRDYPAAIEEYTRVTELRPNSPQAHNNLGVAFKKNGDSDRAKESFSRALDIKEDYAEAWSNRGWVYVEQERWQEAREDFQQVLRLIPKDEGALYGLSRVLRKTRDYAGAQVALRTLIAHYSNFVYWLEWAELQLVRYYWVLLLVAGGFFLHSRYKKVRAKSYGG